MPEVNKNLCIGCGACVSTCPAVFELGSDGKSQVKKNAPNAECIKIAAAQYPVQAISP